MSSASAVVDTWRVTASKGAQPSPTERDLAALWQNQSFPAGALVTSRGQPLRVIYRGRCPGGPGPDFRDALISAPWGLLQGDVELHVRSSDFRRHGHDTDAAYNAVVLHLVFLDDEPAGTWLECGARVTTAALAPWVEGRAAEIRRWLERPLPWREPCYSVVERLGIEHSAEALDRLGDMRFRRKTAEFARRLKGGEAEQLLWESLMEALAYGGHRDAFRLLAGRVRWTDLRDRLVAAPAKERVALASAMLTDALGGTAGECSAAARPGNRPQERLRGAATLASRFAEPGLLQGLLAHLGELPGASRDLTRLLTVPRAIGSPRALEMLVNAVLPCLAAIGPEEQTRRAENVYRRLRLPARYGAVKHLHEALAPEIPINARRQQGMLYLYKQYCTQGGCGRCPLS